MQAAEEPNAFEKAMRQVTGNEDYRFGDLTRETVGAVNERVVETVSDLSGKNASEYEFGDISRKAIANLAGKERFEDCSRAPIKPGSYLPSLVWWSPYTRFRRSAVVRQVR